METVLLYSKYSNCTNKLIEEIKKSGVNTAPFKIQMLCVDNSKIRNRILKNKQIDVSTIPCLLLIYQDGGIEKFDGNHIFDWFRELIRKSRPVEQVSRIQQVEQVEPVEQVNRVEPAQVDREMLRKRREEEENRRKYEERINEKSEQKNTQEAKPRRRKQIKQELDEDNKTSIDDLPDLEDRHSSIRPPPSIRKDSGNYDRDSDLFQGSPPDMRKSKKSAIKPVESSKNSDILQKAKEMAKGREEDSTQVHAKRPII